MLYDTGSETQLINGSLATRLKIPTITAGVTLLFGGGAKASCSKRTTRQLLRIQGGQFFEQFVLTQEDIPGVDIILGMGFQKRSGANIVWPKKDSKDVPYLLFNDGTRWYGEDVVGGDMDSSQTIRTLNGSDVNSYFSSANKADNGPIDALFAVSVSECGEITAQPAEEVKRDIHPLLAAKIAKFPDIFRTDLPTDLPEQRQGQPNSIHKIPLVDGAEPVKVRPIPMSYGEQLILQELLQELLEKGYISPAPRNCPWSAPIILLKKGAGDRPGPVSARWRIITDYRALNNLTKPSVYVPPSVRDVLDQLSGKKIFSKSDNLSGFYQASLAREDREKTTFTCYTPDGKKSYYFNVACLGLQGTPSTYQLFMEDVIDGIQDVFCYLDDMVYVSNTWEEHAELLEKVFLRLRENKVYLNASKCVWGTLGIDFLGMHVSHDRVSISEEKKQGLRDFPPPTSHADVRRFIGFINYMGQFVRHFSLKIAAIASTLKGNPGKRTKFIWTAGMQQEFDDIKLALIAATGLHIPDLRGEFVLETDASQLGLGAVLYQFAEEQLKPVWFLSHRFSSAEMNYNTRDREALAVVHALKKCMVYLMLKKFVLYSDHESLAEHSQRSQA